MPDQQISMNLWARALQGGTGSRKKEGQDMVGEGIIPETLSGVKRLEYTLKQHA
jgi:hypothetical protein